MTSAFGRAKILLGEAVKEDQAGNAEEALKWYKQGCTELLVAIKEATDPKQTAGYSKALKNYLLRAEQMKKMSAAQRKAAAQHNPWEKLFGPNVHLEDSSSCLLKPEAALKNKKVVCLYFSSAADSSASALTPRLGSLYSALSNRNALEVVYCSSDRSQADFSAKFASMPWLALPFEERRVVGKLRQRFGFASNTTELVVLEGGTAKVLKTNGKDDFQGLGDPSSWIEMASSARHPHPTGASGSRQSNKWADEKLGQQLRLRDGRVLSASEALRGKRVVVLLFSAHWKDGCAGVCDKLLLLHTMYTGQCGGEAYSPFEVVWISSEKSEADWNQVYQNLPFAALPWGERRTKGRLEHTHGVFHSTLPKVVVLDGGNGRELIKDATQILIEGVSASEYPLGENANLDLVKRWLLSSSQPGNYGVPIARITSVKVPGYSSPVPKVLVHLWFHLVKGGGLRTEGIFRISPGKREEGKLVAQLDSNAWPKVTNPHAAANLIKLFLRQLPKQLLTAVTMVLRPTSGQVPDYMAEHSAPQVAGQERNGQLRSVIRQLPEPQRSVLLWLADRLVLVARASKDNKMDPHALAIVFAPNLLKIPGSASSWNTNVMRDRQQHVRVLTNFTEALILMRDSASFAKPKPAAKDPKKVDAAKPTSAAATKDPTRSGSGGAAAKASTGAAAAAGAGAAAAAAAGNVGSKVGGTDKAKPKQTPQPKPKTGPIPGVFEPPEDAVAANGSNASASVANGKQPSSATVTKPPATAPAVKPQTSIGNNVCVLSIKTLTGQSFFVKVNENMTFGTIKQEHLVQKVGGPTAAITLIKDGKRIPDAASPRLLGFGSSKGKAKTLLPLHLVKRKSTNQPPTGTVVAAAEVITPGVAVASTAVADAKMITPGVSPASKTANATPGVNVVSKSTTGVQPASAGQNSARGTSATPKPYPAPTPTLTPPPRAPPPSTVVAGSPVTGTPHAVTGTPHAAPPSNPPTLPPTTTTSTSRPVSQFRAPPPTQTPTNASAGASAGARAGARAGAGAGAGAGGSTSARAGASARRPRTFSDDSVSALSKLQSLSVLMSKHEHTLKQIQTAVSDPAADAFELLSEAKTELSILNGRVNKIQVEKDAVQTMSLKSGQTVARVARKALNTRMETVLTSIQSLFEDLIERMGKLDDDS